MNRTFSSYLRSRSLHDFQPLIYYTIFTALCLTSAYYLNRPSLRLCALIAGLLFLWWAAKELYDFWRDYLLDAADPPSSKDQ